MNQTRVIVELTLSEVETLRDSLDRLACLPWGHVSKSERDAAYKLDEKLSGCLSDWPSDDEWSDGHLV